MTPPEPYDDVPLPSSGIGVVGLVRRSWPNPKLMLRLMVFYGSYRSDRTATLA
jgi:hypothetical protein